MRKIFLMFLAFLPLVCFAQSLKGGIEGGDYSDFLEQVNLSVYQKEQILRIRNEEENVLKPLILDVASKEEGLEFLKGLKCDFFDSKCKQLLKEDIALREFERNEVLRKIVQKKNYYRIRYRNVLTREQDIKIQQLAEETAHRDKVLLERAEAAKKRERVEKLKFWNKFKR